MARVTNISGTDQRVPLIEEATGQPSVAAGETVEVPDRLVADYTWPETTWKVEQSKPAKAPKASGPNE